MSQNVSKENKQQQQQLMSLFNRDALLPWNVECLFTNKSNHALTFWSHAKHVLLLMQAHGHQSVDEQILMVFEKAERLRNGVYADGSLRICNMKRAFAYYAAALIMTSSSSSLSSSCKQIEYIIEPAKAGNVFDNPAFAGKESKTEQKPPVPSRISALLARAMSRIGEFFMYGYETIKIDLTIAYRCFWHAWCRGDAGAAAWMVRLSWQQHHHHFGTFLLLNSTMAWLTAGVNQNCAMAKILSSTLLKTETTWLDDSYRPVCPDLHYLLATVKLQEKVAGSSDSLRVMRHLQTAAATGHAGAQHLLASLIIRQSEEMELDMGVQVAAASASAAAALTAASIAPAALTPASDRETSQQTLAQVILDSAARQGHWDAMADLSTIFLYKNDNMRDGVMWAQKALHCMSKFEKEFLETRLELTGEFAGMTWAHLFGVASYAAAIVHWNLGQAAVHGWNMTANLKLALSHFREAHAACPINSTTLRQAALSLVEKYSSQILD